MAFITFYWLMFYETDLFINKANSYCTAHYTQLLNTFNNSNLQINKKSYTLQDVWLDKMHRLKDTCLLNTY